MKAPIKYQTLLVTASVLRVLAWAMGIIGTVSSIFLGVAATTLIPKLYILLGGLMITAIGTTALVAASKLIYLLIDIEVDLSRIAEGQKAKGKD